jgi:Methyltransferase domain
MRTARVYFRNMLYAGNLVSLALLRDRQRWFSYVSESFFLYRSIGHRRGARPANVFEVLPSKSGIEEVSLGYLVPPVEGKFEPWFTELSSYTADLVSICLLCKLLQPKLVFEIGTFHGYTTFHLALNTPAETRIITLDLEAHREKTEKRVTIGDEPLLQDLGRGHDFVFDVHPAAAKIERLVGDSATFDFSRFHRSVDLFLIDGAHTYEYVRADTFNALKCIAPGGVIAWHDYGRTGFNEISPFIDELARNRSLYAIPGGSLAFMRMEEPRG